MRGLIERLGLVEGLDIIPLLLREGRLLCGTDRGADRIDRLGVDREIDGADRLGVGRLVELRLLLRRLRAERWASAPEASSKAASAATATANTAELDFFFVNIVALLPPTACDPGHPDLPISRVATGTPHALRKSYGESPSSQGPSGADLL